MRVNKGGKIVDIPVKAGTVVALRENRSGKVDFHHRAVVVGAAPASSFSRAYGKQVYVCTVSRGGAHIHEKGAGDVYPLGKGKRVPAVCKKALREYKDTYGK